MSDFSISEYVSKVSPTDKFQKDAVEPVLKGLFGEVGSLITASKKVDREGVVFDSYTQALKEELGDVFWYITALCRRKNYDIEELLKEAHSTRSSSSKLMPPRNSGAIISHEHSFRDLGDLNSYLFNLGQKVADLLKADLTQSDFRSNFLSFLKTYLKTVQSSGISFHDILKKTKRKRWEGLSNQTLISCQHSM